MTLEVDICSTFPASRFHQLRTEANNLIRVNPHFKEIKPGKRTRTDMHTQTYSVNFRVRRYALILLFFSKLP